MKKHNLVIVIVLFFANLANGSCPSSATVIPDLAISGSYTSPITTSGWNGSTVRIEGTFTVTSNFTFQNCRILMAPNASIIINADKKLTLDACWISSCDGVNMWDGIQLPYGSNLTNTPLSLEIKGGSVIEDAQLVVSVSGTSGISVINSQLNRNYEGIQIGPYAQYCTAEVYGNLFSCRGTYNNPSSSGPVLLYPLTGTQAFEGIQNNASSHTFYFGSSSQTENIFEGLMYGIEANNPNTTIIQNNVFRNCNLGVLSNNIQALFVGGSSSNEINDFDNCIGGVNTNFGDAEIRGNTFENNQFPIRCRSGYNFSTHFTFKVINNTMFNFDTGILLDGWDTYALADIDNNHLNPQDDLTYVNNIGILNTNAVNIQNNVTIHDNDISNCIEGIVASHYQTHCSILNNIINIPVDIPAGMYYGLDLYSCQKTLVNFNEVHKYSSNNTVWTEGLRATDLTYGNLVKGNVFFNHETTPMRGIHLYGNCPGVQMECNSFSDCNQAVLLGSTGQQVALSSQGTGSHATENDWAPYDNTYVNRIIANTNFISWYYDYDVSQWYDNGNWPKCNTGANITINGMPWTDVSCGSNPHHIVPARDVDPIINEAVFFDDDMDAHMYNLKSSLYQAFLYSDEMEEDWISDEEYTDWFENLNDSNIGKFERAEYIMFKPIYRNKEDAADSAFSIFDAITPENTAEENKKFMLNIYYNNIMSENYVNDVTRMESEDVDAVEEIAWQNSVDGGEAVLWARIMLNLFIDDEAENNLRKKSHKSASRKSEFSLYPNPNNGNVTIASNTDGATIKFYNIQGNELRRFELSKIIQTFSLNLENGMYIYRISNLNDVVSKSGLISVVK